jgi:hypothetical protein
MQDHTFIGAVEAIHGANRHARRITAMHAGHGDGLFTWYAIIERNDTSAVDAPRYFVLVFTGRYATIAFNATLGVTDKFHSCHKSLLMPSRRCKSLFLIPASW